MKPPFFKRLLQPLCLVGAIVFAVGFGASCVALGADLFLEESRPYQGLLTFVLYPAVMFLGALLLAAGLLRERRRAKKLEAAHAEWRPALDIGKVRHRRILFGIFTFGILFVLASILGATRAYEYTESVDFCGAVCHGPMEPHHVAHQDSPHASIECVECHVAPGVGGYVEAKISGLRQVYEVLADSYDRPIRASREKVPAASETCRECHWEDSISGWEIQNRVRFGYDLRNTRRTLQVLLDVGSKAVGTGIHWHANLANKVWFRATDELRQNIPWVKVERADGTTVVYRDREQELPEGGLESLRE